MSTRGAVQPAVAADVVLAYARNHAAERQNVGQLEVIMGPKAQSLVDTLTMLSGLLRLYGEAHWASWVEGDLDRIRRGDPSGVTHLLSAYYGAGNLSELVFDHEKGHRETVTSIGRANNILSNLRSHAWRLADAIAAEEGPE